LPTPDDPELQLVLKHLRQTSRPPLLVGGAVRDCLLNKKPKDLDFLITGTEISEFETAMAELADTLNLNTIRPAAFPEVIRLVNRDISLDFTFISPETVTENLMERDFTVNAMAMNPADGEIIDPAGGRNDLKQKKLRFVRESAFQKDPVRVIRLFRFQTELGFTPDKTTLKLAKKAAPLLNKPAGERIREELYRILANDNGAVAVKEMAHPILTELFPSLSAIRSIPQNGYHHLDAFGHSLAVTEWTFRIKKLAAIANIPEPDISDKDKIILRLAALFHDTGKADTLAWNENGITTFKKHQIHSGEHFLADIARLNPSKNLTERAAALIRRHMLFLNFMLNGWSENSFRKLIRKMGKDSRLLALLALADKLSANGPLSAGSADKIAKIIGKFIKYYEKEAETIEKLPKLLSGREIMDTLGISSSPEVGKILNEIAEKQLADPAFGREQALQILQTHKKNTQEHKP